MKRKTFLATLLGALAIPFLPKQEFDLVEFITFSPHSGEPHPASLLTVSDEMLEEMFETIQESPGRYKALIPKSYKGRVMVAAHVGGCSAISIIR